MHMNGRIYDPLIGLSYIGGPAGAAIASAYITAIKGGSVFDILGSATITLATAAAFNGVCSLTDGHFVNGVTVHLIQSACRIEGTIPNWPLSRERPSPGASLELSIVSLYFRGHRRLPWLA